MIVCVGLLIPKNTFALQVYNNVNLDYRFFVDEEESDAGSLKFKLYDKSGTLNFESKYDADTKQYYFEYDENTFEDFLYNYGHAWELGGNNHYEGQFRGYVPFSNVISDIDSLDKAQSFIDTYGLHGKVFNNWWSSDYSFYDYVPFILECNNMKKIVFASICIRFQDFSVYYVQLSLINNTNVYKEDSVSLGNSFLENVDFMRKNTLDYSDELWEELNNGPIASSQIYSDLKSSINYKYVNQNINTGEKNVPEETLEDYANSLPVLSFKKVDNIDSNKDDNIVKVITNPKTWNNGVIVLVISMIVIIGSSIVLIKRKSN